MNSSKYNNLYSSDFMLTVNFGADQSITNLNIFTVLDCTGKYFEVDSGTIKIKTAVSLKLLINTYTLATLCDGIGAV